MNRGAEARQGCNRIHLVAAGIIALAIVLCAPAAAHADSGGATVRALPESSSVEVSAQVEHSCESETSCAWFAAAAVYSASSGCPYSFDATHGVWQSGIEQLALPADGRFTISGFTLANMEATIVVCLYVYSEGSTALVGKSHPFNRATGREILPPPPRPPVTSVPPSFGSSPTTLVCEGNSSAVFKAEMKVRPSSCLALGESGASTTHLIHMHWSKWTAREASGHGQVIAKHGEKIGGRFVYRRFAIRVRLTHAAHLCDGSERSFTILEWHDQFGSGRDRQQPDCP